MWITLPMQSKSPQITTLELKKEVGLSNLAELAPTKMSSLVDSTTSPKSFDSSAQLATLNIVEVRPSMCSSAIHNALLDVPSHLLIIFLTRFFIFFVTVLWFSLFLKIMWNYLQLAGLLACMCGMREFFKLEF